MKATTINRLISDAFVYASELEDSTFSASFALSSGTLIEEVAVYHPAVNRDDDVIPVKTNVGDLAFIDVEHVTAVAFHFAGE